jgi:hypothetical protein
LWIEPIITIGTIARLGLDYGWASELLGMQCHDWAFDFAVFETRTASSERIAGEVKKTQKELDLLIDELREFGRLGLTDLPPDESKRLNSFKKWQALLNRRAPLFWAVGPDDYTHAFEVQYEDDLKATFSRVDLDALKPRIDVSIPT